VRYRVYNSSTMLRTLSVFMAWVVFVGSACATKMNAFEAAAASQNPAIKARAVQIPAGSVVEVRLTNQEKLNGRIGDVSDDGIVLKYVRGTRVEERKIAFADMTSIKAVKKLSMGAKIGLVVLALIGVVMAVGYATAGH